MGKPRISFTDTELAVELGARLVGQSAAIEAIVPYVGMFEAGLAPEDRPAGVFLLLGPTGTGKTRTVEALAECIHGDRECMVRIDCGEFFDDHHAARLLGAPPGYIGHLETKPMLSAAALKAARGKLSPLDARRATIKSHPLAIVLFDEIEKAAPSVMRMLLGVLSTGVVTLGNNERVDLRETLLFFTSNLGSATMAAAAQGGIGFSLPGAAPSIDRLRKIGMTAARKHFSPEFMGRLDEIVAYRALERADLEAILQLELAALQRRLASRIELRVTRRACDALLDAGTSPRYGARDLKRVVSRRLAQPVARLLVQGSLPPGAVIRADVARGCAEIRLSAARPRCAVA